MPPTFPRLLALTLMPATTLLHAQDPPPNPRQRALDEAVRNLAEPPQSPPVNPITPQGPVPNPALPPTTTGSTSLGRQTGPFQLIDVALDVMAALGSSTASSDDLLQLKGGQHDPKARGFTLQQAELVLAGAVDPWFTAKSHMVVFQEVGTGETILELEEAYLVTSQLPADLQLKAGTFLTEFGRTNPTHAHTWDWQDQPIINSRVFGEDGMRGPGARLSWLLPTDVYSELLFTAQNANGETMPSFLSSDETYEDRPIGGRSYQDGTVHAVSDLVYTTRLHTGFDVSNTTSMGFGVSGAYGPNATGDDADTWIYGADFVLRWRPLNSGRGWPFFKLQGEFLGRSFRAAEQVDDSDPLSPVTLPSARLGDYGGYLQVVCGFQTNWATGLRLDWVSGSGASYDPGSQTFSRSSDPYRCDRYRLSPMLAYHPSEFSRIRLQYDYEESDHLADPVHSIWLGFEILIGTHPPHTY